MFIFSLKLRWGPIPWLLGAEIFPLCTRAKFMALSTSVNWISKFIITFITPPRFGSIQGGYNFLYLTSLSVDNRITNQLNRKILFVFLKLPSSLFPLPCFRSGFVKVSYPLPF